MTNSSFSGDYMMLRRLIVKPDLPEELQSLRIIGMNMWFTWNPEVSRLFQALDPELWESCSHNPIILLANLTEERKKEKRVKDVLKRTDKFIKETEDLLDKMH